jgi:hypothetical protein
MRTGCFGFEGDDGLEDVPAATFTGDPLAAELVVGAANPPPPTPDLRLSPPPLPLASFSFFSLIETLLVTLPPPPTVTLDLGLIFFFSLTEGAFLAGDEGTGKNLTGDLRPALFKYDDDVAVGIFEGDG